MTIQLNSDTSLAIHEEYSKKLTKLLSDELNRFSEHITSLELHLSDVNGQKDRPNDKRCLLEARLKGRSPIAVSAEANTHDQAVHAAIGKLKTSIEKIEGRLKYHNTIEI